MPAPRQAMAAFALAVLAPASAMAQAVCVECKGPERTYSCTVKDSAKVQHVRGAPRAVEFVCISEIARAGGHESCRVGTGYSGPCIGQQFVVDLSRPLPETETVQTQMPHVKPDGDKPVPQPVKGPPQTLEQLARETMSKSKDQFSAADETMRKAGGAVGNSLKKTWDCMTSLFTRC